ncbi:MAG: DUF418 domain-containing protein [Usitatibacteraceae bacterium]
MARDDLIDALRGLALFGILAVNIQSFVWGVGSPTLGVLYESSSTLDEWALFFTALLLEYKFYPIFCFCFGYGFAVQTRRWLAHRNDAHEHFTRRMNFMLLMGVLHGTLIWFGDILARYAVTGYILRRHIGKGPRALWRAAKYWLGIVIVVAVVFALFSSGSTTDATDVAKQSETAQIEAELVFDTYAEGNYINATIQRAEDFFTISAGYVLVLPQVMLFFLLGALAARLKLLRTPERYRAFWQRIFWLALLLGVPINLGYAASQLATAASPWLPSSASSMLLSTFAPVLSLAYVAAAALWHASGLGKATVRLLAPAGRIALTLYISQSILMMLLLNGFCLGLGATMGQFELFLTALGIYALQLVAAHTMLRYEISAPLEAMWRRYTN